ncbi:MAG: hypothetical protein CVV51_11095 [Spirochaetae bacterium HGW-Spirochaetae-7]|jgi:DMSO reductase anchor subunit|nr:MAG: hypothetical protein CVV51_11095 [Spirochaetae bacterium HGW-Spirochaetae-7]
MDTKNGLINFSLFVFVFIFAFVFSIDALASPNTFYGVLALVGFLVSLGASLFNGILSRRDGEALALWYFVYAVIVGIITVWYLTRCGTAFGWW